jgi:hypothetical protein
LARSWYCYRAGARNGGDLDERRLGQVQAPLGQPRLAETFACIGVVRVDGEGFAIVGDALIPLAELALGVTDHGKDHRVLLVGGRKHRKRLVVVTALGEPAALGEQLLAVEEAGSELDAALALLAADLAGLAGMRRLRRVAVVAVKGEGRNDAPTQQKRQDEPPVNSVTACGGRFV